MFQVAASDFVALGVRCEPAFALAQEFFDFVFADPIVFVVVEDREKNIEVLQDVLQKKF